MPSTTCQRCRKTDCTVAVGDRRLCGRCWMSLWRKLPHGSSVERLAAAAADLAAMQSAAAKKGRTR